MVRSFSRDTYMQNYFSIYCPAALADDSRKTLVSENPGIRKPRRVRGSQGSEDPR